MKTPAIRVLTMPRDTNPEGTIFGGKILSLMDQAGYVEAKRQANMKYVTVQMDEVVFKQPVRVGDILSVYADTLRIGDTSISIRVHVVAERHTGEVVDVTEGRVVFVAIDESGKPTEIPDPAQNEKA